MPHKRLIQGVCVRITARISNFVQWQVGFGKHVFGGFYPFIYKEIFYRNALCLFKLFE